jgi:hypothetical protein
MSGRVHVENYPPTSSRRGLPDRESAPYGASVLKRNDRIGSFSWRWSPRVLALGALEDHLQLLCGRCNQRKGGRL